MGIADMKRHRFAGNQESRLETWKRSHMVCEALLCGRFADFQELRFKSENRSDTWCDEVHWCPFAYCQIWYFQSAKCSNKRSTILQDVRFADAQDLRFQASKR